MKDDLDKYDDTIYIIDLNNLKEQPRSILVNGVDYVVGFEWLDKEHNRIIKIEQPFNFKD